MITVQMMVHSVTRTNPQNLEGGLIPRRESHTQNISLCRYGQQIHAPPESETTLEICLRVNHHLNMAYTVYHGASSAASLSVYFLPVPLLVSCLNR